MTMKEFRMTPRSFHHLLKGQWDQGKFLCVGLDPVIEKIPSFLKIGRPDSSTLISKFNAAIVEATKDLAAAYKPNTAFYEAHGLGGIEALMRTVTFIRENAPEVPVILDAKRADIGSTNEAYARFAFDIVGADAVTVHPYLGSEAMKPFLERTDKGIFVLCRTSNPGAGEFQDLVVFDTGRQLFHEVALRVAERWNAQGNCGLVVGATYPRELAEVRALAPSLPILIPGAGKQGGSVEDAVRSGADNRGAGFLINVSRDILYAPSSDTDFDNMPRKKAEEINNAIRTARDAVRLERGWQEVTLVER